MEWWGTGVSHCTYGGIGYPDYVEEYLFRVSKADSDAGHFDCLSRAVTDAINTCLQGLVADGLLGVSGGVLSQSASLIKAACFMMGANTLQGALVPLAADMPAPTNVGFVAGDYNRRTGLMWGNTKYLNTNRANNADPQNSKHVAFYQTQGSAGTHFSARAIGDAGNTFADAGAGGRLSLNSAQLPGVGTAIGSGMYGANRGNGSQLTIRVNNVSTVHSSNSEAPSTANIALGARINTTSGIPEAFANYHLIYYSIGSALDLALLDARISALSTAIQAAIP